MKRDEAAMMESEERSLFPRDVSPDSDIASGSKPEDDNKVAVISTNFKDPAVNVLANVMSVGDLREHVTLGWKNVDVFVELSRASICRRACCGEASDEPQIKQILSDGQFS